MICLIFFFKDGMMYLMLLYKRKQDTC